MARSGARGTARVREGKGPGAGPSTYFAGPGEFRAWLERNGGRARELVVGFHKVGSGTPSLTWPESVDEALCFGWIDGVRRSVDATRYTIRFTPRTPTSTWSAVNMARARELVRLGRMRPAGQAAYDARADERTATYSYEQRRAAALPSAQERRLRADRAAWAFFAAQPPSYRRTAVYWVTSAAREETRERRFASLLACSAAGERIAPLRRPGSQGA
jgi:uncharacterized protein YdeI (YjbR/CyaY-like superfamily)